MTLTFPTIAEQVRDEFNNSSRTISIATLAKRRGAHITRSHFPTRTITYTFDDDTSLITAGTGRNHSVRTELP
jgi:hypothetical protein